MSTCRLFLTIMLLLTNIKATNYIFKGTVINAEGKSIKDVNISLNNNEYGVKTNNDGSFFFDNLIDSVYEIKASHIAYQEFTDMVNVELIKTLNIVLPILKIFCPNQNYNFLMSKKLYFLSWFEICLISLILIFY